MRRRVPDQSTEKRVAREQVGFKAQPLHLVKNLSRVVRLTGGNVGADRQVENRLGDAGGDGGIRVEDLAVEGIVLVGRDEGDEEGLGVGELVEGEDGGEEGEERKRREGGNEGREVGLCPFVEGDEAAGPAG
uniref:Uncharacterized protein n=1 Tax=Rhizophora mucronata TaxID=61149 RepID=A0A2P2Q448_RHIMU